MVTRTTNPSFRFFPRYGGRGIKVCREWDDVHAFIRWANDHGYAPDLQIDRIDNDGDYSPDNCRWVTPATNCRNRSTGVLDADQVQAICARLAEGKTPVLQLAREFGVSRRTVSAIKTGANWTSA